MIEYEGKTCPINISISGTGPESVFFVHGLTSRLEVWTGTVALLSKNARCICLDLPGHGLSGEFENYSLELYIHVLKEVFAAYAPGPAILAGHSMGGLVSIAFAAENPDKVKKLILFAPAGIEKFRPDERLLLQQMVSALYMRQSVFTNLLHDFRNMQSHPEPASAAFLEGLADKYEGTVQHYNMKLVHDCVIAILKFPAYDSLEKIKQATLLFFGDSDRLIPNRLLHGTNTTEIAKDGAAQIMNCKLVIYKNCGHYVQRERTTESAEEIKKFLAPTQS